MGEVDIMTFRAAGTGSSIVGHPEEPGYTDFETEPIILSQLGYTISEILKSLSRNEFQSYGIKADGVMRELGVIDLGTTMGSRINEETSDNESLMDFQGVIVNRLLRNSDGFKGFKYIMKVSYIHSEISGLLEIYCNFKL